MSRRLWDDPMALGPSAPSPWPLVHYPSGLFAYGRPQNIPPPSKAKSSSVISDIHERLSRIKSALATHAELVLSELCDKPHAACSSS